MKLKLEDFEAHIKMHALRSKLNQEIIIKKSI